MTEQQDAMPQRGSSTPPEHIRVVVADDHPMWRDAVARDLADAGFQVVGTAADGLSAIRRVKATSPDVLVLDLNLPGVHGVGVCEQLATEDLPTKILILSVSGERQDVLDAVKAGRPGLPREVGRRARSSWRRFARTAAGEAVFTAGLAGLVLGAAAEALASIGPSAADGDKRLGRSPGRSDSRRSMGGV